MGILYLSQCHLSQCQSSPSWRKKRSYSLDFFFFPLKAKPSTLVIAPFPLHFCSSSPLLIKKFGARKRTYNESTCGREGSLLWGVSRVPGYFSIALRLVSNQQPFVLFNGKNPFPSWLKEGLNLHEEKKT